MPTVWFALHYERKCKFPRRAGRHLGFPESLHFYFIVRN